MHFDLPNLLNRWREFVSDGGHNRARADRVSLRRIFVIAAFLALASEAPPPPLTVTRLDCGKFAINDFEGHGPRTGSNGCYLIRHGATLMLWDTGLPETLIGHPSVSSEATVSLNEALVPQLSRLGLRPADISLVGISHNHGDHLGQAARFPRAKLLIGSQDFGAIKDSPDDSAPIRPWLSPHASKTLVDGDLDVFGDGTVIMLATPGHTPGHHSLLVRLSHRAVLLSGDVVDLREQLARLEIPHNSTDKVAALTSLKRLLEISERERATIIIQHEPLDEAALPGVPKAAQ